MGRGPEVYGARRCCYQTRLVWPNHAQGCMVAATNFGVSRVIGVCRLLDVGRFPGQELHVGAVSFAVLFTGAFRVVTARVVWAEAGSVAELAAIFARVVDSLGTGRFSAHVLLLSRRVLQIVLG